MMANLLVLTPYSVSIQRGMVTIFFLSKFIFVFYVYNALVRPHKINYLILIPAYPSDNGLPRWILFYFEEKKLWKKKFQEK